MEAVTRIIDGEAVSIVPLMGTHSVRMFAKVRKAFGPAVIKTITMLVPILKKDAKSGGKGKEKKFSVNDFLDSDIDFSMIADALSSISENMSPEEEVQFFKELLATTFLNDKSLGDDTMFNTTFSGKVLFLYKIVWATLEVNFGDFFAVVGTGNMSQPAGTVPTKR